MVRPATPRVGRLLLWTALSLPLVGIALGYASGRLFYGEVVHLSGEWSIRLMMAAMLATPLTLMFPGHKVARWLLRNRRYLGVASFAYALLHTVVYLQRTALWADITADAVLPEYLTGWIALLIFAALAATSNDASMRWLRQRWKTLHRLVYVAAVTGFVHWVLVAFNPLPAAAHLSVLLVFEGYRWWKIRQVRRAAGSCRWIT